MSALPGSAQSPAAAVAHGCRGSAAGLLQCCSPPVAVSLLPPGFADWLKWAPEPRQVPATHSVMALCWAAAAAAAIAVAILVNCTAACCHALQQSAAAAAAADDDYAAEWVGPGCANAAHPVGKGLLQGPEGWLLETSLLPQTALDGSEGGDLFARWAPCH